MKDWIPHEIFESIIHHPPPISSARSDVICWGLALDGVFSIKSFYAVVTPQFL
uniref:Uncharacterized protein n=1 Tax=Cajanus cajan TaxID=3821 RepID=A0A151QV22_CAJCA|nr:hypothetical protein KK1_044982 [Cajanus cajan]